MYNNKSNHKIINIIAIIIIILGSIKFFCLKNKVNDAKNKMNEINVENEKNAALFRVSYKWLNCIYSKKDFTNYLFRQNVNNVAIYGMGYLGVILSKALKNKGINVIYGIDRSSDRLYTDVPVISVDEIDDNIDMIIVTPITSFDNIKTELKEYSNKPIISLDYLLNQA